MSRADVHLARLPGRIMKKGKQLSQLNYVRVSVSESDEAAKVQTVSPMGNLDKELFDGIYIPTHERFVRRPPENDPRYLDYLIDETEILLAELKKKRAKRGK